MNARRLDGKTAAITGGVSGIGLATAQKFVSEGAFVFLIGRRKDALDKAIDLLGKENAAGIVGDVGNLADLDRYLKLIADTEKKLYILFVNAGIVELSPVENVSEQQFDKMFDINVRGAYFTVQKALPHFNDSGSIILTSSIAGTKGLAHHSVYSATKAAVRSLARTLTTELAPNGIRVNTISPGAIDTPIIDGQFSDQESANRAKAQFAAGTPLGRIGNADEVADVVLWLASEESAYVTGADIAVDGGFAQV